MSTQGMRKAAPTGQCLTLLRAFRDKGWTPASWELNRLGMLDERARISDLRHRWGILVNAHTERAGRVVSTTYILREECREEAMMLILRGEELEREEKEKAKRRQHGAD